MSRFLKVKKNKKEEGITLIALITTIIVLLILAGISIGAITGSNGIISGAQNAKEETEIAQEKEIIDISTVEAMGKNNKGNLEEEEFQSAIDKHTNEKADVTDIGEEFEVFFEENNRYYTVDKEGNILDYEEVIIDKSPGDITKDENGKGLAGTENEPYEIWCIEDLVTFSIMNNGGNKELEIEEFNFKDSYISLKRTLNFKSIYSYNDYKTNLYGDLNQDGQIDNIKTELTKEDTNCIGFTPIGNNSNYRFSGFF